MKSIHEIIKEQQKSPTYPYQQEINEFKRRISESNDLAIQYAEGLISEEEYAPIKLARQEWRDEINQLEKQIELISSPAKIR